MTESLGLLRDLIVDLDGAENHSKILECEIEGLPSDDDDIPDERII